MSTLHRYRVTYTCACPDSGFGTANWYCRAYSAEHAEEKFYDGTVDEGWTVLKVTRAKEVAS